MIVVYLENPYVDISDNNKTKKVVYMSVIPWEAIMLICFGVSWPTAIMKTVQAKNPAGKSIYFMILIISGYLAGIINKFVINPAAYCDWVRWLYVVKTLMVSTDLTLVLYYRQRRKKLGLD